MGINNEQTRIATCLVIQLDMNFNLPFARLNSLTRRIYYLLLTNFSRLHGMRMYIYINVINCICRKILLDYYVTKSHTNFPIKHSRIKQC